MRITTIMAKYCGIGTFFIKEYEYTKHYKEKDENGNDIVKKITLETINGFKNSDITEFTKSWVDWCFFENPKGRF